MKPAVLAVVVGGVFAVGIGVGVLLNAGAGGEAPAQSARTPTAPRTATEAPRVTFEGGSLSDPNAASGGTAAGESSSAGRSTQETAGPTGTFVGDTAPPSEPPPLPVGALDAEQELRRELDENGGRGNGKVTTLVYDFENEQERQAWEARYKKRWEDRLQREIEIKLKTMREKVGLQAHQEAELRKILQAEFQERGKLVAQLTAKEISRSGFDEGVRANVTKAREALKAVLSPQQLEAYYALKPREQVLRDEIK